MISNKLLLVRLIFHGFILGLDISLVTINKIYLFISIHISSWQIVGTLSRNCNMKLFRSSSVTTENKVEAQVRRERRYRNSSV